MRKNAPSLPDRREARRTHDLALLMQERAELFVAAHEFVPGGILRHFGAAPLPVVQVVKAPQMNDLVQRADLGLEEADQIAEMLELNRQSALFVERNPFRHFQRMKRI